MKKIALIALIFLFSFSSCKNTVINPSNAKVTSRYDVVRISNSTSIGTLEVVDVPNSSSYLRLVLRPDFYTVWSNQSFKAEFDYEGTGTDKNISIFNLIFKSARKDLDFILDGIYLSGDSNKQDEGDLQGVLTRRNGCTVTLSVKSCVTSAFAVKLVNFNPN